MALQKRDDAAGVLREAPHPDHDVRLLASGTEEEADAVAKILGGDSVILKGTGATEAAFKNQSLSRFRVIHFAVHGLVSTKYPERSALVFRPDPDAHEDGFLQAREIASLPIRAELVTLSACAT